MTGQPREIRSSLYIDGAWVEPLDPVCTHEVINPATLSVEARIGLGDLADVDRAANAAHRAFPAYASTSLEYRIGLLEKLCAIYERRMGEVATAVTTEMGAPMHSLSLPAQAPVGLWHFQTAIASARNFAFEYRLNSTTDVVREPIGVCALITPWNWPMNQLVVKLAPALVTGCTIILKPSEHAPLSAILLAEMIDEAGFPAGVFNMVHGQGAKIGDRLASHPLVDLVSLTGSNSAGVSVSRSAASTIKRLSLELGGKSANIILPDADLDQAVTHGVALMMANSGQSCNAPSRLLVQRSRLAESERIATRVADALVLGDPLDERTQVGPLANARQHHTVLRYIQSGIDEGAKLVAGGAFETTERSGYFVAPTIFSQASNDMTIAREEIFGPVLTIIPYDDEDDAVRIANDTVYGLSGYVFGRTVELASATARRLRTGMVHLNGAGPDLQAPFGGYRQSGNGREWGSWGLEDFLETKAIIGGH